MSKRVGSYARCAICGHNKRPRGRSAPLGMHYCEPDECHGYDYPPYAGDLWPGETAEEFGYPCDTTDELNARGTP